MAGLLQKFKEMWAGNDEENEDYEEYEEEEVDNNQRKRVTFKESALKKGEMPENRVVNINATAKLQVVLFKPEKFDDDIRMIANELLKIHTIVLNLENTSKEATRRILDFMSGVAYANGGKIRKVATDTYVITPYNVDLTGDDFLGELENNGVYF